MNHITMYGAEEVSPKELGLTPEQYNEVMQEIWKNHRFGMYPAPAQYKCIKYVRPQWDMRDGICFSIKFEALGLGEDGITFGSGYGNTTPMYERIMKWLNEPRRDEQ